jgi:hypothetical protein
MMQLWKGGRSRNDSRLSGSSLFYRSGTIYGIVFRQSLIAARQVCRSG